MKTMKRKVGILLLAAMALAIPAVASDGYCDCDPSYRSCDPGVLVVYEGPVVVWQPWLLSMMDVFEAMFGLY